MICLKLSEENFEYDVRGLLTSFYPGAEIVLGEKEELLPGDRCLRVDHGNGEIRVRLLTGTGEKVRFTSLTADVWQSTWGLYKTREGDREITVTKGNLRLWVGDTLFWSQECGALDRRSENQGIEIPTEGLTVGAGEKVILSLV